MQWYFNQEIGVYTGDRYSPGDSEISDRPSPDHIWQDDDWMLQLTPNWTGLLTALAASAVYAKAWVASREPENNTVIAIQKANRVGASLNLMMIAIANQRLPDLEFAIATLRSDLAAIAAIGDFSSEELIWINQQLESNNFSLRLS